MSNPIINKLDEYSQIEDNSSSIMTISGTLSSFAVLSLLVILPAMVTWNWAALGYFDKVNAISTIGVFAGFILAMIINFIPKSSPFLSPLYAICEGAFLGGISAIFEMQFKGVVSQAVSATLLVILIMYILFHTKAIKVTPKLTLCILVATGAIAGLYIINIILSLFGFHQLSAFLWGNSPLSIVISFLICGVAAFNLLLDFNIIEKFSQTHAPKYMEWYCAFGLMVTIVWLYIEILKIISKFRSR